MISENRNNHDACAQLRQKFSARFDSFGSAYCGVKPTMKGWNCNKVAGQDDQVWMQVIDDLYRSSDEHSRALVVMKVAELGDGEAFESSGQLGQGYFNGRQKGG